MVKPVKIASSHNLTLAAVSELVAAIPDPEIPVLTIEDLGILRGVRELSSGGFQVDITPTYSGCPAMHAIEDSIVDTLTRAGILQIDVRLVLSPAWTTDWVSQSGRTKMKAYGIAPPSTKVERGMPSTLSVPLFVNRDVECPRCDSNDTRRVSAFGSTACKEHWLCRHCHEPFDHFKCH